MNNLVKWWLTPKFPKDHIEKILNYRAEGLRDQTRNLFRTWVVHPLKRRVSRVYLGFLQKYFGLEVVGITGSSGKTTTKEMLASILKRDGKTVYSFGNIDPVYNIPTTILRCRPSTKYLILEMGVEYPGEMDFYLWLAEPNVGVITNIYSTHTVYFGNIRGVFREKSKLVKKMRKSTQAVLNAQNKYLHGLEGKLKTNVIWYGLGSSIFAEKVKFTQKFTTSFVLHLEGLQLKIEIPVLGKQFVDNSLAAAAAAHVLGVGANQIEWGLENFKMQGHRMSMKQLKSGSLMIDDSYNNNPEAAKRAIELLKSVANKRKTLMVFGDMLELGKDEIKFHKEIRDFIRRNKIDYVVGVGELSRYVVRDRKYWAADWEKARPVVRKLIRKNMIIMIKGSRSIGLDKLADKIK